MSAQRAEGQAQASNLDKRERMETMAYPEPLSRESQAEEANEDKFLGVDTHPRFRKNHVRVHDKREDSKEAERSPCTKECRTCLALFPIPRSWPFLRKSIRRWRGAHDEVVQLPMREM